MLLKNPQTSIDFIYRSVYNTYMEKIDKKEELLNKSLALFSKKGYENVSVQEIVENTGVTKPTLYYHFESKEGVLKSILDEYFNGLNNQLTQACVYNPDPNNYYNDVYLTLTNVVHAFFNYAKKHKDFYVLYISILYSPSTYNVSMLADKYLQKQYDLILNMFIDIADVHKNIKDKEYRYSLSFMGMINSYVALWINNKVALDDNLAKDLIKQFMHGIFS